MQGHFANRDKTGTVGLWGGRFSCWDGWYALVNGNLRLTHAVTHEKPGRKQRNGECLRVIESRVGNPRRFPPYTLDSK